MHVWEHLPERMDYNRKRLAEVLSLAMIAVV